MGLGPMFLLQIVDADPPHTVVMRGPAGAAHALELNLRDAITAAVLKRSVGLLRTKTNVARAVDDAITEVFMDLKRQTIGAAG